MLGATFQNYEQGVSFMLEGLPFFNLESFHFELKNFCEALNYQSQCYADRLQFVCGQEIQIYIN